MIQGRVVWKGDMIQGEGGMEGRHDPGEGSMEGRHDPGGGWYGRETENKDNECIGHIYGIVYLLR